MKSIDLAGFNDKFAASDDPWRTFSDRDEAIKREAILRGLGTGPIGRVLEVASGNGSNSAALAPRVLRLDATDGTERGTELTRQAVAQYPRAITYRLEIPARPRLSHYDAVIVAEVLYYLSSCDARELAREVAAWLGPRGTLVLAHHRIDFPDFTQHAGGINQRFLTWSGRAWRQRTVRATGHWEVVVAQRR